MWSGTNVAVIGELLLAEGADALLGYDPSVKEISHLGIGAKFPVAPRMERVVYATNAHLALAPFP